jgi:hypothetical protein
MTQANPQAKQCVSLNGHRRRAEMPKPFEQEYKQASWAGRVNKAYDRTLTQILNRSLRNNQTVLTDRIMETERLVAISPLISDPRLLLYDKDRDIKVL